ncbi:MAG: protein kinase, partial [Clostridiales bacterium]|nr:protein kinase [Clostridiales bacterium]
MINDGLIEYMASLHEPDRLPERFSPYSLHSCLKHGVNSSVYLLKKGDGKFILKWGNGRCRDILAEEHAFLLRLASCGFLPRAADFFQTGDESWLLREYVEGRTLYELADRSGGLPESEAVQLALKALACVAALHAQNPPIIHRDLKPHNFVLAPDGQVKIIDMGTAREWSAGKTLDTEY